jgi:uncharacterized membrane protein
MRDSLWFIPAALTVLAAVLAFVMVKVDRAVSWQGHSGFWLFGGTADGAREVLSTIAGSLITVTGVIFSVTTVTLQLASSQFTPRILRSFTADRSNQLILGVFIATFTYTLLVLRVVRAHSTRDDFVPQLSVSLAILLALLSIGFLIHFIHHTARSIQPAVILQRVAADAMQGVERLFPQQLGHPAQTRPEPSLPIAQAEMLCAKSNGYLQAVDGRSLFETGERQHLLVKMAKPVGAFILEGQPLAEVWADEPLSDELSDELRQAFIIGPERTPEQDLGVFLIEISDMAVKALSPGINDPTTAIHCIDRLTQILSALGARQPPSPMRTDSGKLHFIAMPYTFERAVDQAFRQVLHYGGENPLIIGKVLRSLEVLERQLPQSRHAALHAIKTATAEQELKSGRR